MDEEFDALIRNHTLDLVPYSPGHNVVGNKWVFKLKLNPNGNVEKYTKPGWLLRDSTKHLELTSRKPLVQW